MSQNEEESSLSEFILEMRHITKEFSGNRAIDDVNLKVRRGEIQPSSNVMYKLAIGLEMTSSEAGQIFFCPVLT